MTRVRLVALAALMMLVFSGAIWAQPGGRGGQRGGQGAPGGQGGPGGQRGGFNIADMWDRFAPRIQETTQIADDEWTLIEPLVRDVITKQFEMGATERAAQGGGGGFNMFRMMGGGRGGPGGEQEEEPAVAALKKTLENKRAKPAEITEKIQAVRDAREKARKEAEAKLKEQQAALAEARKKLREVLTPHQEAQFFLLGMLD